MFLTRLGFGALGIKVVTLQGLVKRQATRQVLKNSLPYSFTITSPALRQLFFEALCFSVIGFFTAQWFGLAESIRIVLALAVAYAVPRGTYAMSAGNSRQGHFVLLALGMFLALCVTDALREYTLGSLGSMQYPDLRSDDGNYYWWAARACNSGQLTFTHGMPFMGFPLLMLGIFKVLGISVVWAVAVNMMFTLLSVVVFAQAAVRILRGRVSAPASTVSSLVMLLCALLFYYLSQGIRVQKEASCYLAIALAAYSLARFCPEGRGRAPLWRDVLVFGLSCVMLALSRWTMGGFVLVGVLVTLLATWRQQRHAALLLLAVAVAVFAVGWPLAYGYGPNRLANIITGRGAMSNLYITGITQEPYKLIIGDYFQFTIFRRLLSLPVSCGVQAIIPFPWLLGGLHGANADTLLPRLGWGWYAVVGVCLYYYIFSGWKRGRLGLWPLWPVACFMAVAYVTGGSLSRYVLPVEPLFAIVAAFTLLKERSNTNHTVFRGWMAAYGVGLIAVLVTCYGVQSSYVAAAIASLQSAALP